MQLVRPGVETATVSTPALRVNDFAIKLANVNGTGSASANGLLMQAVFRMGIPVPARICSRRIFKACRHGTKSA
jgi:hypothetical protein